MPNVPMIPGTIGPQSIRMKQPISPMRSPQTFTIAGVTRNANGSALGNCALVLFRAADDSIAARGNSDANGQYSMGASSQVTHYAVAYLPGSPDIAGTTVNTIVGT